MPSKSGARRETLIRVCAICLTSAAFSTSVHGEELTVFTGTVDGNDGAPASYSWQIEYRQQLLPQMDASFSYVNEGHFPGHQRDGQTVQLWAVTPRWLNRFDLAVGAGPYVYFDTQSTSVPPYFRDDHGVGAIITGSLSYYGGERWFLRLNLSDVYVPGGLDTHMLLLGAGYNVDSILERIGAPIEPDDASSPVHARNELGPFIGQSIENSDSSGKSTNFGIEYRRRVARHLELSASWLNEAVGIDGRHDGVTGEAWLMGTMLNRRLSAGIGVGPYVTLHSYRVDDGRSAASLTGLASMTVSWRMTRSTALRVVWHRSFTQDDQDRDIVTLGFAWRWGR